MASKTIAIHQPNFFPWLGFFNKIHSSDVFVYLDHVENNPRTAIYTKRVKILVNKQEHWLTCGLKNEPGKVFVPINKMQIDNPGRLKDKHLKTLELSYKKSLFFTEAFSVVEEFYDHKSDLISERNIHVINLICEKLNINTKKISSGNLNIHSASNQLLIDIIKNVKGTCYLPGGGAGDYQDDELFAQNDITLKFQNFIHPVYEQTNSDSFVKGLSLIDSLMNIGFKETELIIKNA